MNIIECFPQFATLHSICSPMESKSVDLRSLNYEHLDQNIRIQGRVHKIRKKGNIYFIILRYQMSSLQIIAFKKTIPEDQFLNLAKLTVESIIVGYGKLKKSPVIIDFTSYKEFELELLNWELISLAKQVPFQIDDANDFGESFRSDVKFYTKMENRWLDLRTPVNHCVFKIRAMILQLFREYLTKNNFLEIQSPKIIGTASEGGAQVFELKYFERKAYLAQSPQLYKQMAINSDFDRVFEVGPVFRAENAITTRHLCEFTGLDLEMTLSKNYHELLEVIWNLLTYIFDHLKENCAKEIEYIQEKIPFECVVYPKEPLILTFQECIQLLKEDNQKQNEFEDLSTENEKRLGEIVKQKWKTDLFIIDKYPLNVRPFYTMPCPEDPHYSCGFDIIMRCTEISSGSQRIHDYQMLQESIYRNKIDITTLHSYLESFSYGSGPHGGCGFGLERILSLYLNLGNVKLGSYYYRDPKRLNP
jgi:aspartyl-tRNA synthetase